MRSKRLLLRFRRLSLNKIFLSNGQFKHCNNKVLINLYIFNRQKNNLLNRLKKIYLSFNFLMQRDKSNFLLKKALNIIEKKAQYKIKNYQSLNYYSSFFYKKVLKLIMRKYRLFFLYKKLLFLNESKTNYTYLRILKKNLEIIYNKNVEFNLINLKRFYLNSDILSEALKTKITRKRSKLNFYLKKIKNKIKIQPKSFFTGFKEILEKEKKEMFVVNNLKYRHVTGFKLQASGRLTRRYTASRSLKRVRYAGNLLNIDSSYRAMSCALLKGNLKSNLQFSKLASKTRIGSFGLKG
ncbi:hypothetical protein BT93_L2463 [Corymbia citriodora subsp. variegata]|uniref:Small ribosomal subunit protein uS3m n=1 Tax=Corymbia citriodora subsp. variegata TaxID=360336 RepID=A0A8T0CJP5_CORYI|nr:hypothetical protein BT93_L2463 [Corymbia citriodora subsp. variegata]